MTILGMPDFERGPRDPRKRVPFEAGSLPEHEKENLCRALLAEFGATNIRNGGDGEIIHSCVLPFGGHRHGDRNPSASLNYRKLCYKCLGCGNGGGLLWFIAVCRGTSATEARSWVTDQSSEQDLAALLEEFDRIYSPERFSPPPMPDMDRSVLRPWLAIHPWLTEDRGIPEDNLVHFWVGWNPETRRVVIPHFFESRLVGWQARRLVSDGTPKYLSSPDFPKEWTIFNYDQGRTRAVVVESPMSVVAKWHVCPEMEATFGASVTERQILRLAYHAQVVLWFDNDKAGWKATKEVGERLLPYADVWVVDNPYAADPADLDDDTVLRLVEEPVPFALWRSPKTLKEVEHAEG